jgi:hypothetical protein
MVLIRKTDSLFVNLLQRSVVAIEDGEPKINSDGNVINVLVAITNSSTYTVICIVGNKVNTGIASGPSLCSYQRQQSVPVSALNEFKFEIMLQRII